MSYSAWSVTFGEQPSASKWNILGTNDASFNNGTGIGTNAIAAASLQTNAIALGYAQITTDFTTTSTSSTLVTGLSIAVTIPAGGRRTEIEVWAQAFGANVDANQATTVTLWDGTVGSGTQLSQATNSNSNAARIVVPLIMKYSAVIAAGSKTFNVGLKTSDGAKAALISAAATYPAYISVKAI